MKKKIDEKVIDQFIKSDVIIKRIIYVAGSLNSDVREGDLNEFLNECSLIEFKALFPDFDFSEEESFFMGKDELIREMRIYFLENNRLGFIAEVLAPKKSWRNKYNYSSTWSLCHSSKIYVDDIENLFPDILDHIKLIQLREKRLQGFA